MHTNPDDPARSVEVGLGRLSWLAKSGSWGVHSSDLNRLTRSNKKNTQLHRCHHTSLACAGQGKRTQIISHARRYHAHLWGILPVFMIRALWMWGMTPPPAMVALMRVSSSSSPRIANWRWRGVMRLTLRSLLAFPANSRTSAVRYSRMAAE